MARRIEELGDVRDAGDELDGRLLRWAREECGDRVRERLAELGLLPQSVLVAGKSLGEHLEDFETAKRHKRRKRENIRTDAVQIMVSRLERLIHECGFASYLDMCRGEAVFLDWREQAGGKDGLGHQTLNHYLSAAKEFGRWMVKTERAARVAFATVEPLNVEDDRRLERRSLKTEEFQRLMDAAYRRPKIDQGLSGFERAALWWFVADTGLRLGEFEAMTTLDLQLFPKEGYGLVRLPGKATKNGEPLFQAIASPGLIGMLQEIVSLKAPGAKLFAVGRNLRNALKRDLCEAGVPFKDARGEQFDVHALRYEFGSRMFEGGASLNVIQKAMRHSTIELTAKRYARARDNQMIDAARAMPALRRPDGPTPTSADAGKAESA